MSRPQLYDGEKREHLLEAYHREAVMSMSVAYPPFAVPGKDNLKRYLSAGSRNLTRVRPDGDKREQALRQGRLKVVSFLSDLPKTEHCMSSFTLDITLATERLVSFTVTGVFRDRDADQLPFRHFNRMFVVVPQARLPPQNHKHHNM